MPNSNLKISKRISYQFILKEIRRRRKHKDKIIVHDLSHKKPERPEKALRGILMKLIGLGLVSQKVSPSEKLEKEIKVYLEAIGAFLRNKYATPERPKNNTNNKRSLP